MYITRSSRLFSIWLLAFLLSFNILPTPIFSQTQKDVEKAAKKNNIKKLIKLYDKASKKYNYNIKNKIESAIRQISDPSVIYDMIVALKNENRNIRAVAAIALGKMNDPRAVDPLILALNDQDEYVRRSAISALACTKDSRAIKALVRGLTYDNCKYWPGPSELSALEEMGQTIKKSLIEALNDEDPLVRGGAAFALGDLKFNVDLEPLIAVLSDENTNVRKLALLGLRARMKDSLVVEHFISVALKDSIAEIKEIAMNTLLDLKAPFPRAMEIYIAALNSGNMKIQAKAAANLLKLETPEAIEFHTKAYISLLNSDDEAMRMKAAKTLTKLKEPIPAEARTRAEKIIAEESFIKLFTVYDQYQRKGFTSLENTDGSMIAEQSYEYHDFNNMLISRTVTIDLDSQDTLRITNYNNFGKPENYKYLCFDKQGNIIKKESKTVLVELFQFAQKEKSKTSYVGFTKVKSYEEVKIYPCQDCAQKTSIANCRYVW